MEIVANRGKRASEIIMPFETIVRDDIIASLGVAKFADEAKFGKRDVLDGLECKSHISGQY